MATITLNPIAGNDVVDGAEHGGPLVISGTTTGIQDTGSSPQNLLTNPSFDDGLSGWTPIFGAVTDTATSGQVTITGSDGTQGIEQTFATVAGETYTIRMDVTARSGQWAFFVRDMVTEAIVGDVQYVNATGGYYYTFTATGTSSKVFVENNFALNNSITIASISLPASTVSVELNGQTYQAPVIGGQWSVEVPAADVAALPNGPLTVNANVTDAAGDAATVSRAVTVDIALIGIDPITGDDFINAAEHQAELTITGTSSGIEAGRVVTVTLNAKTYTGMIGADGKWSVKVEIADVAALADSASPYGVQASASDQSGNEAVDVRGLLVNAVNDKPTDITLTGTAAAEGANGGAFIGTLTGVDADGTANHEFKLLDDAQGRFTINGNQLVVANGLLLDYEKATSHQVKVQLTDGGLTVEKTFTVSVTNVVNENLFGSSGGDKLLGGSSRDVFRGLVGNDELKGGAGSDFIDGGLGNDKLYGGLGKDVLIGGKGRDTFVFDTKPSKANVDKVVDFRVADDSFQFDNAVFKALGKGSPTKPGKLDKDFFQIGSRAQDGDDHLIYNKKTGALSYDVDGAGGKAAVLVATLTKNLKLTHADFFVI